MLTAQCDKCYVPLSHPRSGRASGPVSRVLSRTAIYLERQSPAASSAQPGRAAGHRIAPLFALAPDGVCQAAPLPTRWCALTAPFQLFSRQAGESSFLWHFPSGRPAQPLAGILPCGARTFLACGACATVWPTRTPHCSVYSDTQGRVCVEWGVSPNHTF